MVRMARFLSDDPGWVDPDDRLSQRLEADDAEWEDVDPRLRPKRRRKARRRTDVADATLDKRLNPQRNAASSTAAAKSPQAETDTTD